MRIAQVAPLYESVPPYRYGGTERVVSYLTEELVRQGHDVTLFASGDSVTKARLVSPCQHSLRSNKQCVEQTAPHVLMLEQLYNETPGFDFVHFHIDYIHFPVVRLRKTPCVTTLHGRLDLPEHVSLYQEFREMPVVSISNAQRKPLPWLHWQGTVYHGFHKDLYTFREKPGKYLAFLGRISPEKRPDRAIRIAQQAGMELKIAAKVDAKDQKYFESAIKPMLKGPYVDYIGEIEEDEKDEFLGNAFALLFPIDWPEPFGLVIIEAMACGTPVIAYRQGSVPELVEDGQSGFIVDNIETAVRAAQRVPSLSRRRCREIFEKRFSVERMTEDYLKIYRRLLREKRMSSTVLPKEVSFGKNH
ncbi:MAG: glycosyltransferase family 4 protein [Elusimicrobia bacterium]|nr:glycosyltransferase family 4 protein [Elusimicrobiota bacterium]